eukprot:3937455-Rhodomonas_salina.1
MGAQSAGDKDAGLYYSDGYDEDDVHRDEQSKQLKGKTSRAGTTSGGGGSCGPATRALNAVNGHATILQDLVSHMKAKPPPIPSVPAPAADTAASLELQIQLLEVQKELAALKEKA